MKKETVRKARQGDDLEVLSEIIKNDPWLLEKVLTKIRVARGMKSVLESQAGKTDTSSKPRDE